MALIVSLTVRVEAMVAPTLAMIVCASITRPTPRYPQDRAYASYVFYHYEPSRRGIAISHRRRTPQKGPWMVEGGTAEGDQVTFHALTPATLFFSDRPQRVVGHMSAQQFVDEWDKGENSFAADPPNAVISFLDGDDETPADAIVVIKEPRLEGDSITY